MRKISLLTELANYLILSNITNCDKTSSGSLATDLAILGIDFGRRIKEV